MLAVTGLRMCYTADAHLPFDVSVDVSGEDIPSGVVFEMGLKTIRDRSRNNLLQLDVTRVFIDTPHSNTDRKHLLQFGVDRSRRFFEAKLVTPFKSYTGSGQYNDDTDDKRVELELEEDGSEIAAAVMAYERTEDVARDQVTWQLRSRVHMQHLQQEVSMTSRLDYVRGESLKGEISASGFGTESSLTCNFIF